MQKDLENVFFWKGLGYVQPCGSIWLNTLLQSKVATGEPNDPPYQLYEMSNREPDNHTFA